MRGAVALLVLLSAFGAGAVDMSDRYRSPRNPERAIRRTTELIVLHTTEAPARSSLNKVSDRGECHFCVTEDGSIYRIVDRDRVAFHAGRSMWNGREDVDKFSIGIECVGNHDVAMGLVQLRAISALVKELQSMYRIPDECVVAHSHVAYGAPNKWQKSKHRGRKRCGMLFATATVRRILGLAKRPTSDADVRARRLIVGDPYLEKVLYGGLDTMARFYPTVVAPKPALAAIRAKPAPSQPRRAAAAPAPKVQQKAAAQKPQPAKAPPPKAHPKLLPKTPPKSVADLRARGYAQCGTISAGVTALKVAGSKWNASDTYYTIRDKVIPGDRIDPARIEKGMSVWMRK